MKSNLHTSERSRSAVSTRPSTAAACGLLLMALGAVGCGTADLTEDAPLAEPLALFRDPSTSGPRLDVYDLDGHTAISVSGPIGTEGMLSNFKGGESLAELYRAIHPSASTVPAELVTLDEQVAPELAALRSINRAPVQVAPVIIEKSQSTFTSTVCKTFDEGRTRYTPKECRWAEVGTGMSVGQSTTGKIFAGDRTYGWNPNANPSRISWYYRSGAGWQRHSTEVTLPAYWWNWMSISSGGPYWASIVGTATTSAERGLTWHARSFTIE